MKFSTVASFEFWSKPEIDFSSLFLCISFKNKKESFFLIENEKNGYTDFAHTQKKNIN